MTWTRREAMRTSALWLTILAYGFGSLGTTGLALHLFPYLTDVGLPELTAAAVYSAHAASLTAS